MNVIEYLRNKTAQFYVRIILSFITAFSLAIANLGYSLSDFTTWPGLFEAFVEIISNPYILGLTIVQLWQSFTQSDKRTVKVQKLSDVKKVENIVKTKE